MSIFDDYKNDPTATKKVLFELDIGRLNSFWINYSPYVWYLNLDDNYPLLSVFPPNHGDYRIENIGSVLEDSQPLQIYTTINDVQNNSGSFYFDTTTKNLYIQCTDSEKPATHTMFIGEVFGFSKTAEYFNNVYYKPALSNVSNIIMSKDPLYFGKISFKSFNVTINNLDGEYDRLGEDYNVFGNKGRIYFGYEDIPYNEYKLLYSGFVQNINISTSEIEIILEDERRRFSRSLPINIFDSTTYPDIKEPNINKPIPLGFGSIKNAPVICINEDESPIPTNYNFKICDTELHEIKSISTPVYVNGIAVTPASTDTATATFVITSASGDYTPGDEVTCDFVGYIDNAGIEIENGLDIIKTLLQDYYNLNYNNAIYNVDNWDLATTKTFDIGIFINTETVLFDIIEEIANSIQTDIFYQTDGKLTAIKYEPNKAAIQELNREDYLILPSIEYDATEVTTSTTILHTKDWKDNSYLILQDKTQEDSLFLIHKTYINKKVETLLQSSSNAQDYSDALLSISGTVKKIIEFQCDISILIDREITNFIITPIVRQLDEMIGNAKSEIITLNIDLNTNKTTVQCRIVEIPEEIIYQNCILWDGDLWDGDLWGGGIAGG